MRRYVALVLFVLAGMPAGFPQAQDKTKPETPVAGASVLVAKATNKLPHHLIHPGDLFYPELLANKGVQGIVTLQVRLSSTGKATAAKVVISSKSSELDRNALAFVQNGYWKLPDNGLKYNEGAYTLPVIFLRDTVLTINKKTCADFNTDLGYFRSVRPGENTKNLGAFELIANVMTMQLMQNHAADETLKFVKAVDAINGNTAKACAKKPSELFVKTYVNVSRQHNIKF